MVYIILYICSVPILHTVNCTFINMWRKWRKEEGKMCHCKKHTMPSGTNALFRWLINCYHVTLDVSAFPLYRWPFSSRFITLLGEVTVGWQAFQFNKTSLYTNHVTKRTTYWTAQSKLLSHHTQPESVTGLSRYCKTSDRDWNISVQLVEMLKQPWKKVC